MPKYNPATTVSHLRTVFREIDRLLQNVIEM